MSGFGGAQENIEVVGAVLDNVAALSQAVNSLEDLDVNFYRSIDSEFSQNIDKTGSSLLKIINDLVKCVDSDGFKAQEPPIDEYGEDSLNDNWKKVSNAFDNILEKSDISFDLYLRNKNNIENLMINKNANSKPSDVHINNNPTNNHNNKDSEFTYLDDGQENVASNQNRRIEKPQLKFKIPVDNSENGPFKPKISSKPNALTPFDQVYNLVQYDYKSSNLKSSNSLDTNMDTDSEIDNPFHYNHPYQYEIQNQPYPESILFKSEPIPSKDWNNTTAIWIDTTKKLNKMIEHLKIQSEIAVDLEHHDYRTYYGLVCLMQISSRENDYIIDTLKLRDELSPLNLIFTDPNIIKVFHGAFMDIIWLQRDLGLYIVSLFDTYHASRLLGFPKHSLAYLLETFAKFKTSKKYQLADWRIRPLTNIMLQYARSDTHFLLYIFDILKKLLLEKDLLKNVLYESRQVAKRKFEYNKFAPAEYDSNIVSPNISRNFDKREPWRSLITQYNIPFSKEITLINLFKWRDQTARDLDESVSYIMPNQFLISLVISCPTDVPGILSCSNFIPDAVRSNVKRIAEIIQDSLIELKNIVFDHVVPKNSNYLQNNNYRFKIEDDYSIDERTVNKLTSNFNKLLNLSNYRLKPNLNLIKSNSRLFSNNMILTKNNVNDYIWCVNFDSFSNIKSKDINDLIERKNKIDNALNNSENLLQTKMNLNEKVEQKITTENQNIMIIDDDDDDDNDDDNDSDEEKSKKLKKEKLDPREVIVLRTRNLTLTNKKSEPVSEVISDKIDYSSTEKKFLKKDAKKATKKRKAWNPYTAQVEGIQPVKRIHRKNNTKSVSYKK
ncbi:exosome nuclease subunit RRP6 ASCRUDRAFT_6614 [Ascoidea rubescens DSM 1968]|uniref:HRDC domain-containing protein n=1 Tax=Ascoidea rubescens DSM 1968 TaxID=1344418 RepID=A0A1D2VN16_9ASCO|nr:hypothetical protein ASCRUDRAFT_6614 [Ascoidea rubescens DSM 1968]ODV63008.1 hypothetical protein ASCRUDRAFT_6614 [Ascoidea rubescens DSM 1968]